jgi:hypothetical protein
MSTIVGSKYSSSYRLSALVMVEFGPVTVGDSPVRSCRIRSSDQQTVLTKKRKDSSQLRSIDAKNFKLIDENIEF